MNESAMERELQSETRFNHGPAYPQVPSSSYDFDRYMTIRRWSSLWHQVSLISSLRPQQVVEVGVGSGLLKVICNTMSISHLSVDLASDLNPDIHASILDLPLADQSCDVSCAFQVLEHIPYAEALLGFRELCRVSRKDILISLPNASSAYPCMISAPLLGSWRRLIQLPIGPVSRMIPSHRWEIGRAGCSVRRVVRDFSEVADLVRDYRVFEIPYHHFFHFRRR